MVRYEIPKWQLQTGKIMFYNKLCLYQISSNYTHGL